jgi:hypothetical protein
MHFKSGRNSGIIVCAPEGTTLKVMVQNKIQVRRSHLINMFRELFDRSTYIDDVRTSRETHLWVSTACYGDCFTFLYVDDVRTS